MYEYMGMYYKVRLCIVQFFLDAQTDVFKTNPTYRMIPMIPLALKWFHNSHIQNYTLKMYKPFLCRKIAVFGFILKVFKTDKRVGL